MGELLEEIQRRIDVIESRSHEEKMLASMYNFIKVFPAFERDLVAELKQHQLQLTGCQIDNLGGIIEYMEGEEFSVNKLRPLLHEKEEAGRSLSVRIAKASISHSRPYYDADNDRLSAIQAREASLEPLHQPHAI